MVEIAQNSEERLGKKTKPVSEMYASYPQIECFQKLYSHHHGI